MDLLAGYGSGGESDQEPQETAPAPHHGAGSHIARPSPANNAAPAGMGDPSAGTLLSKLPAPSSGKTTLFSGLPKPKPAAKKVVVQFRVPITYGDAPAAAADDDEEPSKKKRKTSSRGMSLSDYLPAPKNAGRGMAQRMDAGSGGSAQHRQRQRRYDSDEDDIVPGTDDRTGMELGAGDPNEPEDNEAYRVQPGEAAGAAAYGGGEGYGQPPGYASYGYAQHAQQAIDPGQAALDAALAAEQERASRQGGADPFAAAGIQFKEVKADQIRHMDPSQRASMSAVRTALGSDYEARLRAEAGPSVPSKLARRKHQIGALYSHAKAKELEDFERKVQGSKSKAETHAKYGW